MRHVQHAERIRMRRAVAQFSTWKHNAKLLRADRKASELRVSRGLRRWVAGKATWDATQARLAERQAKKKKIVPLRNLQQQGFPQRQNSKGSTDKQKRLAQKGALLPQQCGPAQEQGFGKEQGFTGFGKEQHPLLSPGQGPFSPTPFSVCSPSPFAVSSLGPSPGLSQEHIRHTALSVAGGVGGPDDQAGENMGSTQVQLISLKQHGGVLEVSSVHALPLSTVVTLCA